MRVEVTSTAPIDWDGFVGLHPGSTAYHYTSAIEIGRRAFGLPCWYLAARGDDGGLRGVLPLVEQSSLLFGRNLTSVPFFTYGGILATGQEAPRALAEAAEALRGRRRAGHVELRHTLAMPELQLPHRMDKVSMVLALPDSTDQLQKQLGAKLRSQIRRPERESIQVQWGGAELLPQFYGVFAPAMHGLGTPVYPLQFFYCALEGFGDKARVVLLRMAGEVHAAAILLRHPATCEVPWAAASPEGKQKSLNMRMYWELLLQTLSDGRREFDFGRSTIDSGTYKFKAQWGAVARQLYWHYCMPEGRALPMLNQSNPKFAIAARLWSRMPLWCANLLGPRIARSLP
jgi:serine/alanine adding enzyme